ncbi:MAG: hypothetical protein GY898_01475 [Proteobacteria bacterium]|nr:hypothetical protein [Pseudomonadota bacterium]
MPAHRREAAVPASTSTTGSVQFHRDGSGGVFADRPSAREGGFGAAAAAHGLQDVQFKGDNPKKKVTGKAGGRLGHAAKALKHTKEVMKFGAGNQAEALKATNFNSYFRMKVMRDPSCWELAPSVRAIANANRDSLTAAKADLAHGGNCGEHAQVGLDYLNTIAKGETLNRSAVEGLDHAFVIMGDIGKEGDADLVVCDPWPTAATACTWEDHFAYTPDKTKIKASRTITASGQNVKDVIARGLRLSPRGQKLINQRWDDKRTDEQIEKDMGGWIWEHGPAASEEYDYVVDAGGDDDDK